MTDPTGKSYPGQDSYEDIASRFDAEEFHVKQLIGRANIATLVQVKKISNTGDLAPVGLLDATLLVNMIDGDNNTYTHGAVHNIPYLRLFAAGGDKAVIMDPEVGDIGLCVFADRDISSVKNTLKQSNPGSRRRNDVADGLYLGGFLSNKTPTKFVQFKSNGAIVMGVGSSSSAFECVTASDHVQIKKKGDPTLHLTIVTGHIYYGKALEGPINDPYPED